ncbi:MAG: zinc metallopeptidase [Chloroflexota bacterium]
MFFDSTYLFMVLIPSMVLGFIASRLVQSRFRKYSQVGTLRRLTGAQVAREILDSNGLYDVRVEESQGGQLSDHYDPRGRVLRLSPEVGRVASVAAVGVAAHEAGHAIQHAKGYFPLQIRSTLVPAASFGSQWAPWIIMGGIVLQFSLASGLGIAIAWLGVIAFGLATLFTLITLPVEFDASSRAKKLLYQHNIVDKQELSGVSSMLNAAALTYIVAALAALGQLLYYVFYLTGASRD